MAWTAKTKLEEEFKRNGRKYKVDKGQVIASSDEEHKLMLLKKGFVKYYLIANDGSHRVLKIFGPGDIFPLTLAYKILLEQDVYKGTEIYHYQAISDIEVFKLDSDTLKLKVESSPLMYRDLFAEAGRHLKSSTQHLENTTLKSSYNKVAHQLAYFAKKFGKQTRRGSKIKIPLTHQDIADILSVARETVSPAMMELRQKGLIIVNKHIIVPNINKLEKEAYK